MRKLLLSLSLSLIYALPSFAQSQAGLAGITCVLQNASGGALSGANSQAECASKGVLTESGKPDSGLIV